MRRKRCALAPLAPLYFACGRAWEASTITGLERHGRQEVAGGAVLQGTAQRARTPMPPSTHPPHQDPNSASYLDAPPHDDYAIPCSINGAMAALSGGALGFVFGGGSRLARSAGAAAPPGGRLAASLADGRASAKSFALFGGVYAAVSCVAARLRDAEDAWNGAVAGCVTGVAVSGAPTPAAALQSCLLFGAFSYFIDRMQAGRAVAAEVGGSGAALAAGRTRGVATRRRPCSRARGCAVDPITAAAMAALPPEWFRAGWLAQR